jgi:UDP-glucose 4-epimerase
VSVLVTGGAGYIGSHVVRLLRERGDQVAVADDLSTGFEDRVSGLPLVPVDLAADGAPDLLAAAMSEHEVDAIVHLAARKRVDESVERPAWYYRQNVGGLAGLLLAAERAGVKRFVFSSSAAVYGAVDGRVDEEHATEPVSPYGATKLAGEQVVAAAAAAHGIAAASLRYFNVGGASAPELADREAQNLIPLVFDALEAGRAPEIFGDDYQTIDGTGVRDYVHVADVARAHLDVLDVLSRPGHRVYNVGTGEGTSVRQMVDRIREVSGIAVEPVVRPRRAGDTDEVVAVARRIRDEAGWQPRFGLDDIVRSAWEARKLLPGYD